MRSLALFLAAGLAACGGDRSSPALYEDDADFAVDFSDPGEGAVADAVRGLPFKHVEWEYKFNDKPISRLTLAGDQLLIETPDNRVLAMDRFNGKTQWIFKIHTETPLDWAPVVAEGVPEEIRQLEDDMRLVNRQIDDKLKELGPGKETQALQKKRNELKERLRVAAFGDNVYFISRQTIYCLDRISGGLRWTHRLTFVPAARPFAIRNYVFVPGADLARVWALDVEKKGQEVTFYKADITTIRNQIMNRPVYSPPSLYFVCHDGKVYSYNVDNGNLNWTYPTERELMCDPTVFLYRHAEAGPAKAGAPAGAPDLKGGEMKPGMGAMGAGGMGAKPEMGGAMGAGGAMGGPPQDGAKKGPARAVATTRFLFAGGTDNAFYALDADAGAIVWKYECGSPIKNQAIAKGSTVYVSSEDGALHAFEVMPMHRDGKGAPIGVKRNGNLRWKIPLAERFLFKGKDRVYVMGPRSEIWALDEKTGAVSGRYKTDLLHHVLTNTADEYMYVANAAGYVYCLKESKEAY
jgi:outer membrane protein assembly factor BamB